MTSFPTGLLRFAGNWDAGTTYIYGLYVIASDNLAYGCGATSDTGTDPTVQPSLVWFLYPQSGGGGSPSTWSTYPATSTVDIAGNIIDNVDVIALQTIKDANGSVGTAGQLLASSGTISRWEDPILVDNPQLVSSTPIATTGTTLLTSTVSPSLTSSATVTASINYQSVSGGNNNLSMDVKYVINGGSSTVLDIANITSEGNGDKASCVLTGLIIGITAGDTLTVTLTATADGVSHFTVVRASMLVQYNMAP